MRRIHLVRVVLFLSCLGAALFVVIFSPSVVVVHRRTGDDDNNDNNNDNDDDEARAEKRIPVSSSSSSSSSSNALLLLRLPRPYLFVHIPKSGGTSIGLLAERVENGGGDEHFIRYWHHPVHPKVIAEMTTHDFVFGHFKWGLHEHFAPHNCTYFTFLRDPVDRVVSHYYYHLNSKTDRFHSLAAKYPLEEWVERSMDAKNDQTQFLSGRYGVPDEETFETAKAHLETFGFVGLFERMEESVLLLKYYAGFDYLFFNRTKSVHHRPQVSDLDPLVRAKIEEHTKYDLELYKIGQRMFEEQIARVGPLFYEDLRRYRQELEDYRITHTECKDCFDNDKPSSSSS